MNSKAKPEIIPENWKAIIEAEEVLKEQTGDPEAGFNANLFTFGPKTLFIPLMYRKKKGDDFTQKMYEKMIIAKYCPFTGKPLYKDLETIK